MTLKRIASWILIFIIIFSIHGCSGEKKQPVPYVTNEKQEESISAGKTDSTLPTKEQVITNYAKKEVNIPYIPISYTAKVEPYTVSGNLSNIENLKQFGIFTPEQQELLSKNTFFVSPAKEEQLFYTYEKNAYLKIPNLITSDSVLQVYNVFFDYSLRRTERDKLIIDAEKLTESMLLKSINMYNTIKNPDLKTCALKNGAYFTVAQMALQKPLPSILPMEIRKLAEKEYALIKSEEGFKRSEIFPFKIDYSQFRPRGHYTNSDDYKRYFRALMWYGQAPFPLYLDKEEAKRDVEQTLQALLITYNMFLGSEGTPDIELWENIYETTCLYVGKSDDLAFYEYKDLLFKVYGQNPNIEKLNDSGKLNLLYQEAKKLPEPKIQSKYTSVDTPVGKQFRFIGQRYIPDSEILGELVDPVERPLPSGLDVMGVLGSNRAYEIQSKDNKWDGYPLAFNKMKDSFSKLPDTTWRSNMYYGWLWTLKSLTSSYGKGYPSFMVNKAWEDKSLNTSLGSWSELRHDTILYGKQIGAEAGGYELPKVLGYVEPSVEVYSKLQWLTGYSRENLDKRGLLSAEVKGAMESFNNLLGFLINCSIKELRNEELTEDEYRDIFTYGGRLEWLTSELISDEMGKWSEITSESGKNMAVIADFFTNAADNSYMQAGVGPGYEIYAVVPIGGKLYLTRGAVFSYYEFLNKSGKRLTDQEWQAMIKDNKQPQQPSWTMSFTAGAKPPIPLPDEPYNAPNESREP